MPFSVSIECTGDTCLVRAGGTAGLAELSSLVAMAAHFVQSHAHRRVLADLGAVEPGLSFTEYLRLGGHVASAKVAAIVPPGYVGTPAEKAARLMGLCIRTFLNAEEATQWLQQSGWEGSERVRMGQHESGPLLWDSQAHGH